MAELFYRPWGLPGRARRSGPLPVGEFQIDRLQRGGLWLYEAERLKLEIDTGAEPVESFALQTDVRRLSYLPVPLRQTRGTVLKGGHGETRIIWSHVPDRPLKPEPQSPEELAAHRIMLRARGVWDRLRDVDSALADPARLWQELGCRWMQEHHGDPQMDTIVLQARSLVRTLQELDRSPRRILRRTHQQLPVSRVQELDRRSMGWLVRQPGETLAERAGDQQRILAVAREENFDTLENRVLRAYAELARQVARDYCERNSLSKASPRYRLVFEYGAGCRRLARSLADRGVRIAEAGVSPNFVLQQNPRYQKIWDAWHELQKDRKKEDELWRWQGRSWEEFCALATMVALVSVPGAEVIASAPLNFRDEQLHGSWVVQDNPLGVLYLPEQGLVVEVRYRMAHPGGHRADFAAPIWIRTGRINEALGSQSNIAVWPVWDPHGGLVADEAQEIQGVLKANPRERLTAGIVLRPDAGNDDLGLESMPNVLIATIGTQGDALWMGVSALSEFLSSVITRQVR